MSRWYKVLIGILLFHALSAVGGGIGLVTGTLPVPTVLLQNTPFDSYVIPGLFLGAVIGGSALAGAVCPPYPRATITVRKCRNGFRHGRLDRGRDDPHRRLQLASGLLPAHRTTGRRRIAPSVQRRGEVAEGHDVSLTIGDFDELVCRGY